MEIISSFDKILQKQDLLDAGLKSLNLLKEQWEEIERKIVTLDLELQ